MFAKAPDGRRRSDPIKRTLEEDLDRRAILELWVGADQPRPRRAGALVDRGPPTAVALFTRNNNRGAQHAKAGKQAREGNHPAQLRS